MASTWFNLMIENPTKNAAVMSSEAGGLLLPRRDLVNLSIRLHEQQFQLDAAMWYGAITTGPYSDVLLKLFSIFYYAGIIYRAGDSWQDWSKNPGTNVASLLSHGQRVLVQIPTSQKGGDELWAWLTRTEDIPRRRGATHGQSRESPPFKHLMAGHYKYVCERGGGVIYGGVQAVSGAILGRHHGFNVALGGEGNRNPFSAANDDIKHTYEPIDADGRNGHVYINYMAPSRDKVGGMLVGCENAEPGRGKNPHTKAGHSLFGKGQDISVCGGKKWKEWKCGPRQEYNGFICDLTDRDADLEWLFNKPLFEADWLDQPTHQIVPVRMGQDKIAVEMAKRPRQLGYEDEEWNAEDDG
jgi:hypothetical protein